MISLYATIIGLLFVACYFMCLYRKEVDYGVELKKELLKLEPFKAGYITLCRKASSRGKIEKHKRKGKIGNGKLNGRRKSKQ